MRAKLIPKKSSKPRRLPDPGRGAGWFLFRNEIRITVWRTVKVMKFTGCFMEHAVWQMHLLNGFIGQAPVRIIPGRQFIGFFEQVMRS